MRSQAVTRSAALTLPLGKPRMDAARASLERGRRGMVEVVGRLVEVPDTCARRG